MDITKNTRIEIRPISNKNGIRKFSENLEYFSQSHIIAPFVDPVTMKYKTGLTKKDSKHLKNHNFPYDISDNYIKGEAHEFWESSLIKIELKNNPIFLFPGKSLLDFVKYKYLLVNSYIYNSEEEMQTGSKPEATHYIYDESESIQNKANKLERKNQLIAEVRELSPTMKRDIILVILNEDTENKNEDYLTVRFEDIVKNKDLSVQLESILSKDAEEVRVRSDIKKAIQKNVLRRTKKGISFFDTTIGYSEDDVKKYLMDSENQELYLNIKEKIQ